MQDVDGTGTRPGSFRSGYGRSGQLELLSVPYHDSGAVDELIFEAKVSGQRQRMLDPSGVWIETPLDGSMTSALEDTIFYFRVDTHSGLVNNVWHSDALSGSESVQFFKGLASTFQTQWPSICAVQEGAALPDSWETDVEDSTGFHQAHYSVQEGQNKKLPVLDGFKSRLSWHIGPTTVILRDFTSADYYDYPGSPFCAALPYAKQLTARVMYTTRITYPADTDRYVSMPVEIEHHGSVQQWQPRDDLTLREYIAATSKRQEEEGRESWASAPPTKAYVPVVRHSTTRIHLFSIRRVSIGSSDRSGSSWVTKGRTRRLTSVIALEAMDEDFGDMLTLEEAGMHGPALLHAHPATVSRRLSPFEAAYSQLGRLQQARRLEGASGSISLIQEGLYTHPVLQEIARIVGDADDRSPMVLSSSSGRLDGDHGREDGATLNSANPSEPLRTQPAIQLLLDAIMCHHPSLHDDSVPQVSGTDTGPTVDGRPSVIDCDMLIANVTKARPDALLAVSRLLLVDPCTVDGLLGEDSYISVFQAAHALRDNVIPEPACDAGVYVESVLSDRMVANLISKFASLGSHRLYGRDAQLLLAHMITRPDLYRYHTVLEHALMATLSIDVPSDQLINSVVIAAESLDKDAVLMHQSEIRTKAVLVATAVLRNARSSRAEGDIALARAEHSTISLLHGEYERVRPVMEAREHHVRTATEMAAALWPMMSSSWRNQYRAAARQMKEKEAEKVWLLPDFSAAEREKWDAEGAATLRDALLQESKGNILQLERQRAELFAGLHAATTLAAMTNAAVSEMPAKRRLELSKEGGGLHPRAPHGKVFSALGFDASQLLSEKGLSFVPEGFVFPEPLAFDADDVHPGDAAWHTTEAAGYSITNHSALEHDSDGQVRRLARMARVLSMVSESQVNTTAFAEYWFMRGADRLKRHVEASGRNLDDWSYHEDDIKEANRHTDTIIRAISNLGHPATLPLVLNLTSHENQAVRHAAIDALRFLPSRHAIPRAHRKPRLLTVSSPLSKSDLASLAVDDPARVHAHVAETISGFLSLQHASLFPHVTQGSRALDVEELLLETFITHHDMESKTAAVHALMDLQPLRSSTLDLLADWMEEHLPHWTPSEWDDCQPRCILASAECDVVSEVTCKTQCEHKCSAEKGVARAIVILMAKRVIHAAEENAAFEQPLHEVLDGAPVVAAGARRLHEKNVLHREVWRTTIDPSTFRSGTVDHAGSRRHLSAVGTTSPRPRGLATHNGKPTAHHIQRARRLGALTLIDIRLANDIRFGIVAGSQQWAGFGIEVMMRQSLALRIGTYPADSATENAHSHAASIPCL